MEVDGRFCGNRWKRPRNLHSTSMKASIYFYIRPSASMEAGGTFHQNRLKNQMVWKNALTWRYCSKRGIVRPTFIVTMLSSQRILAYRWGFLHLISMRACARTTTVRVKTSSQLWLWQKDSCIVQQIRSLEARCTEWAKRFIRASIFPLDQYWRWALTNSESWWPVSVLGGPRRFMLTV